METIVFQLLQQTSGFQKEEKEFVDKLNGLLQLRSQYDIELHVKEVKKRSTRTETENSGLILAGFKHLRSEILEN